MLSEGAIAPKVLTVCTVEVRWRDLDAYDHVNNATYLTWLEEARIRWLSGLPEPWRGVDHEPVLAHTAIDYRVPVRHPARVTVDLRLARIGASSVHFLQQVCGEDGRLHADACSVLVWIDPRNARSRPLPEFVRTALGG